MSAYLSNLANIETNYYGMTDIPTMTGGAITKCAMCYSVIDSSCTGSSGISFQHHLSSLSSSVIFH